MTNKTIKNQDSLYKEQLENVYLEVYISTPLNIC